MKLSRFLDFVSEVLRTALILAVVTAGLAVALFHALGINPFRR